MSRQAPSLSVSEDVISQLGYDPHAIPSMSEQQVFEYLRVLSSHITRSAVRRAIQHREIRGVRKGRKFLYSRRAAINWLMASDDDNA